VVADVCPRCGRALVTGAACACGEPEDDPELEAWLLAREADLDEQAFALADQFDERWPGPTRERGPSC
jgi:hypothetical protein